MHPTVFITDMTKDTWSASGSLEPIKQRTPLRRIVGQKMHGLLVYKVGCSACLTVIISDLLHMISNDLAIFGEVCRRSLIFIYRCTFLSQFNPACKASCDTEFCLDGINL